MAELISATKTSENVWVVTLQYTADGVTHNIQIPSGTGEVSSPSSVYTYKNSKGEDAEEEYSLSDNNGDGSSFSMMGYHGGGSAILNFDVNPSSPSTFSASIESGLSGTSLLDINSVPTYEYVYKDDDGNINTVVAPVYTIGNSEEGLINLGDDMVLRTVSGKLPTILGPEDTDGKRLTIMLKTTGEVQSIDVKSDTEDDIYIPRIKDLGLVSAYGAAKAGGWSGTESQFNTRMADVVKGKIPVNPSPEPTEDGSIWITT